MLCCAVAGSIVAESEVLTYFDLRSHATSKETLYGRENAYPSLDLAFECKREFRSNLLLSPSGDACPRRRNVHKGMLALPTFIPADAKGCRRSLQTVKRCKLGLGLLIVFSTCFVCSCSVNEHSTQFHVGQQLQRRINAVQVHVARIVSCSATSNALALLVILRTEVGQPVAMNAERGRGGRRGRGRHSSGRNNGQRGGGRSIYRSNSDGQGANAFPPGLRVPDSQYSSSVPTASGWDLPEDSQQNGTTDLRQAAIQAADRAINVPVRQQGQYRGNRAQRRNSGGFNATDNSPGVGHSQSGQNRHGASVERDSGPSSFGRRSSDTRQAQSNIVPIPQRYVSSPNGTFHSPGNGQQAAGTPDSRSRNGTAHVVLKSVALHTSNSTPVVTTQSCGDNPKLHVCVCVPYFGI